MAEATLNDVTNAIEASNKNRSTQQKFSEFNEYRRNKSNGKILNSLVNEVKALMLPAQTLVKEFKILSSAQIDFIKLMGAKFELDEELRKRQDRLKLLTSPTSKGFDLSSLPKSAFSKIFGSLSKGFSGIIEVLKKNKLGILTLALGGLLTVMALFPKKFKTYVQEPLADLIGIFSGGGNDPTTMFGKGVKSLRDFMSTIGDIFGTKVEGAGWAIGLASTIAVLSKAGIPTFGVGKLAITGLKGVLAVITAFPPVFAGIAAVAGIYAALELLRDIAVNDELEILEEQREKLRDAVASEDAKAIAGAAARLRETMKRLEDTGLTRSQAIRDKMVETQEELSTIANKNQAEALAKLNEVTSLAANKAVTKQIVQDLKIGASAAFDTLIQDKANTNAQVAEVERQLGLIDQNTSLSDSDKKLLVDSILSVARKRFDRKFDTAIDKEGGMMDVRFKAAREKRLKYDMFGEMAGESPGDIVDKTMKELKERGTKVNAVAAQKAENQAAQLAANARRRGGGTDANIIAAPTTNDSRDQSSKIYNYTFYSTDSKRGGPGTNRRYQVPASF
jgi:hypothetical protein